MDKPSVWIVGHYHDDDKRLRLAVARVPNRGERPWRDTDDYQAALDAARATMPAGMLGCTHKVLGRSEAHAREVFHRLAAFWCGRESHGRPAARIEPSA